MFLDKTPYLNNQKLIKKFETITYENDLQIYETLKDHHLVTDLITYVINVQHHNGVGEQYENPPDLVAFSVETPYRQFEEILVPLLLSS